MTKRLILVLVCYALLTAARLPDWQSDRTLWIAAAETDPDDQWALNNAAAMAQDARTLDLLAHVTLLPIPDWLTDSGRETYIVAYRNLSQILRAHGDTAAADVLFARAKQIAPSRVHEAKR